MKQRAAQLANQFLTIQESADLLKVSAKTLRRWEEKGVLVPQRSEGGHRRYDRAEVVEFKRLFGRGKHRLSSIGEEVKLENFNHAVSPLNSSSTVVEKVETPVKISEPMKTADELPVAPLQPERLVVPTSSVRPTPQVHQSSFQSTEYQEIGNHRELHSISEAPATSFLDSVPSSISSFENRFMKDGLSSEKDVRHPELDSGSFLEARKTHNKDAGSRSGMTSNQSSMTSAHAGLTSANVGMTKMRTFGRGVALVSLAAFAVILFKLSPLPKSGAVAQLLDNIHLGEAASTVKIAAVSTPGKVLGAFTQISWPSLPKFDFFSDESTKIANKTTLRSTVLGDVRVNDNLVFKFNVPIKSYESATFAKGLTADGEVAANGGVLSSTAASFELLNKNVKTLSLAGEATQITIGSAAGTTEIKNVLQVADITKIAGVTYTFPTTQGASTSFLKNDGSGKLVWQTIFVPTQLSDLTGTLTVGNGGTGSSSFSSGSILFSDGSKITESNANFFWDNSNKRLGLLTKAPAATFSVGANSEFQVDSGGSIAAVTGYTQASGNFLISGASSSATISNLASNNGVVYTNSSGQLQVVTPGNVGQCLLINSLSALSWQTCTVAPDSQFGQYNGFISPASMTADFGVGGNSTASAKIALLNIGSGTPTISLANGSSNLLLAADGTISTTNNQPLVLGNSSTGNIGIHNSNPAFTLDINGTLNVTSSATLNGGLTAMGGQIFTGGLDNSGAGITNAGAITGATGFTSSGTITLSGLSTGIVHSGIGGVLTSSPLDLAGGAGELTGSLQPTSGGTGITAYNTGDLIYASAPNTLAVRGIGGNSQVLTVAGGVPTWASITGAEGICPNCLINNPGSNQILQASTSGAIGLSVRQPVGGTVDIFNITDSTGTAKYFRVDSTGNIILGQGSSTGVFTVNPSGSDPISIVPATNNGTAYTGTLTSAVLTQNRTWTLPDMSGDFCLSSGNCTGGGAAVSGTGTINRIAKFQSTSGLTDSQLFDDGTNVGIGNFAPSYKLDVNGNFRAAGAAVLANNLAVSGAATVSGTLIGQGATSLQSTLGVTGATTLSATLNVTGATVLNSTLAVTGNGTFGTNTLFADTLNNKVGVGTITPSAALDVVNASATTNNGIAGTFNGLTSGFGLSLSSTSTALTTGGLASFDWSPGSATTATGDLISLNVGANGTIGNIFNIKNNGSSVFAVSQSQIIANLPTQFTSPGDVGFAYDIQMTNPTSSFVKSVASLYLQAGETFGSSDLTLRAFNSGNVVLDSAYVTLAQSQNWTLNASTSALNIASNLLNFDTVNNRLSIGTNSALATFDVRGGNSTVPNASISGTTSMASLVVDQSGIGDLFTASKSGATKFVIANNGNVGIGIAAPTGALHVLDLQNRNLIFGGTKGFRTDTTGTFGDSTLADAPDVNSTFYIKSTLASRNVLLLRAAASQTGSLLQWQNSAGTGLGAIDAAGNLGLGTTTPTAALDVVNTTTTTTNGISGAFNGLTSGFGLSLSSTSTALTTGGLASFDWSPGSATTATGDLISLNVGANGTIGNIFNIKNNGSSVFAVSQNQITANLPTQFTSPGDVSFAYDLQFTNPTSSYIKSNAPLYLQAGETFNSSDLTLRAFNSGNIVLDSAYVTLAQNQAWTLTSSTSALNIASNLLNFDTVNNRLSIGTTSALATFDVRSGNSTVPNASISGTTSMASLVVDQSGIGDLFTASKSGATKFVIANNGNVGIGKAFPISALDVVGDVRTNSGSAVYTSFVQDAAGNGPYINLTSSQVQIAQRLAANTILDLKMVSSATGNPFLISSATASGDLFKVASSGFVGIGNNAPSAVLDVVNPNIATTNGISGAFNGLTSGFGLSLSSTSTALTTGGLASFDWSPGSATTATGDLISLNVGANGTIGNIFNIKNNGSSVFAVSQSQIIANLPTQFTSPGDVSFAYDLQFTNPTASFIKSSAPLYLQAGESYASSDLTLRTFNSGYVVLDSPGGLSLSQSQSWYLTASTSALNIASNLLNFDTINNRVSIGTNSALAAFDVRGGNSTVPNASISGTTSLASLVVDQSGIGDLFTASKSGATKFVIANNGNVGIGTANPSNLLTINGNGQQATIPALRVDRETTDTLGNFYFGSGSYEATNTRDFAIGYNSSILRMTSKGGEFRINEKNDSPITFYNNNTERMRIAAGGNVGIGNTTPSAVLDVVNATASTTNGISGAFNGLTSGFGLSLSSTSTALTTGGLASFDWSPGSAATASGDLISLNVGANGTIGNIFNIKNNGSSVFSVSQNQITANLPTQFTSPGDVSFAYDLQFTNPTASFVKSTSALILQAGENYNSSDLTLRAFNNGNIVLDSAYVTLNQNQAWTLNASTSALNIASNLLNFDTINNRLSIGTTSALATLDIRGGNSTVPNASVSGTTSMSSLVVDQSGIGDLFTASKSGATKFVINNAGNVGIGTAAPTSNLDIFQSSSSTPGLRVFTTSTPASETNVLSLDVAGNLGSYRGPAIQFKAPNGSGTSREVAQIIGSTGASNAGGALNFKTTDSGNTLQSRLFIENNGNVGIGTTTPAFKLDVTDTQASSASAMITNTNTGATATGFAIKLGFTGTGTSTNYFETYLNGNGNIQGKVQSNGANGVTYATNGIDLAEYFVKDNPDAQFPVGTIMCQGDHGVRACAPGETGRMVGIVSANPAFLGGVPGSNKVIVALNGQVPARVNTSHGAIKSGDPISFSINSGVGAKVTQAGAYVGTALADYDSTDPSQEGTVMVYVNPSFTDPDTNLVASDLKNYSLSELVNGSFIVNTPAGQILSKVLTASDAVIGNLTAGKITAQSIQTESLNIGSLSLDQYIAQVVQSLGTNQAAPAATPSASVTASVSGVNLSAFTALASGSAQVASGAGQVRVKLADLKTTESDVVISGTATYLSKYFETAGDAFIGNNLGVNAAVVVGKGLALHDGGIDYLESVSAADRNLSLLGSGKGSVNVLAGLMKLDDSGKVAITGDLTVHGRVSLDDPDAAGFAKIKAGDSQVNIVFARPYSEVPVITAVADDGDARFTITNKSVNGFTITLKVPQVVGGSDVNFNWTALNILNAKTFVSPSATVSGTVAGATSSN